MISSSSSRSPLGSLLDGLLDRFIFMASVLKDNLGTGLTRNILNNYVGSSAVSESAISITRETIFFSFSSSSNEGGLSLQLE